MKTPEPGFGTDGVRGVANEQLTALLALKLGVASAHVLGKHSSDRHVVVGRDTRLSGEMLEAALNAGLASMGALVTNLGVVPTPAVSQATILSKATAGVVISASHNPFIDNGIKFFGADGKKLSDAVECEITDAMKKYDSLPKPHGTEIGRIVDSRTLVYQYADQVRNTASGSLKGLKLVLDCANGAAFELGPQIFRDLGAEVIAIFTSPDGININKDCGSTHLTDLKGATIKYRADAGLAFDGDCDRVMMVDETGQEVDGDHMMAILAIGMKSRGELVGDSLVATVMSNAGLQVTLKEHGINLVRTDVGDRYVAEEMVRSGAVLGGEQSGHILMPTITPTGDGMVTGLRILAEMRDSGRKLSELAGVVTQFPQRLGKIKTKDRTGWMTIPEIQSEIEDCRGLMTNPEWLNVRASGTEPVVRVMVQDREAAKVDEIHSRLMTVIKTYWGEHVNF